MLNVKDSKLSLVKGKIFNQAPYDPKLYKYLNNPTVVFDRRKPPKQTISKNAQEVQGHIYNQAPYNPKLNRYNITPQNYKTQEAKVNADIAIKKDLTDRVTESNTGDMMRLDKKRRDYAPLLESLATAGVVINQAINSPREMSEAIKSMLIDITKTKPKSEWAKAIPDALKQLAVSIMDNVKKGVIKPDDVPVIIADIERDPDLDFLVDMPEGVAEPEEAIDARNIVESMKNTLKARFRYVFDGANSPDQINAAIDAAINGLLESEYYDNLKTVFTAAGVAEYGPLVLDAVQKALSAEARSIDQRDKRNATLQIINHKFRASEPIEDAPDEFAPPVAMLSALMRRHFSNVFKRAEFYPEFAANMRDATAVIRNSEEYRQASAGMTDDDLLALIGAALNEMAQGRTKVSTATKMRWIADWLEEPDAAEELTEEEEEEEYFDAPDVGDEPRTRREILTDIRNVMNDEVENVFTSRTPEGIASNVRDVSERISNLLSYRLAQAELEDIGEDADELLRNELKSALRTEVDLRIDESRRKRYKDIVNSVIDDEVAQPEPEIEFTPAVIEEPVNPADIGLPEPEEDEFPEEEPTEEEPTEEEEEPISAPSDEELSAAEPETSRSGLVRRDDFIVYDDIVRGAINGNQIQYRDDNGFLRMTSMEANEIDRLFTNSAESLTVRPAVQNALKESILYPFGDTPPGDLGRPLSTDLMEREQEGFNIILIVNGADGAKRYKQETEKRNVVLTRGRKKSYTGKRFEIPVELFIAMINFEIDKVPSNQFDPNTMRQALDDIPRFKTGYDNFKEFLQNAKATDSDVYKHFVMVGGAKKPKKFTRPKSFKMSINLVLRKGNNFVDIQDGHLKAKLTPKKNLIINMDGTEVMTEPVTEKDLSAIFNNIPPEDRKPLTPHQDDISLVIAQSNLEQPARVDKYASTPVSYSKMKGGSSEITPDVFNEIVNQLDKKLTGGAISKKEYLRVMRGLENA